MAWLLAGKLELPQNGNPYPSLPQRQVATCILLAFHCSLHRLKDARGALRVGVNAVAFHAADQLGEAGCALNAFMPGSRIPYLTRTAFLRDVSVQGDCADFSEFLQLVVTVRTVQKFHQDLGVYQCLWVGK